MWQAEADKARPVPSVGAQAHMEFGELDPGRERPLRLTHSQAL